MNEAVPQIEHVPEKKTKFTHHRHTSWNVTRPLQPLKDDEPIFDEN